MGDAADTFLDGELEKEAAMIPKLDPEDIDMILGDTGNTYNVSIEDSKTSESLWDVDLRASSNKNAMMKFRREHSDVRKKYLSKGGCRLRVKKI